MSRNGSGTYSLPAGNPVVTGTPISSTVHNNTMTDLANAITQSLAYDGQTVPIANIPFGGFKATGLGAATTNGDAVRYEQLISNSPASLVRRLIGNVNATTPLTKYDIAADIVVLQSSASGTVTRTSTGTITCDLGLAGSVANGRDQAGAFTASSWIYLYFIWNGATLASLASTTAPASFTGSTLPSGYTHWCFAAAIRWNGSSNIIPVNISGSKAIYDSDASVTRVLSGGLATTFTAVSLASFVPPICRRANILVGHYVNHNTANVEFASNYRPTGSTNAVGFVLTDLYSQVINISNMVAVAHEVSTNSSQQIDYKLSATSTTGLGLFIDVRGYTLPNGDA